MGRLTTEEINKIVGRKILELMRRRGYNQRELAEAVGYSADAAINQIVNGKRYPGREKMQKIADVLQVPVQFLQNATEYNEEEWDAIQALYTIIQDKNKNPEAYKHAIFLLKKLAK